MGCERLADNGQPWKGVLLDNEWVCQRILEGITRSRVWLDSFEMPLLGNQARYCGVPEPTYFRSTLTRLSLSLNRFWCSCAIHDYLRYMEHLKSLEISIVNFRGTTFHQVHLVEYLDEVFQHPKLEEFYLMSDNQNSFLGPDISQLLGCFPNIESVGFAHIMLSNGTWSRLIQDLAPLKLETLWLLSPRDITILNHGAGPWQDAAWPAVEYTEDQYLKDAAAEVRLVHTESLTDAKGMLALSYDFEYPGFAMFERL